MSGPISGRVLAIAGSDSGGGAGIQADIKTITALGGYAATAITGDHGAGHPGRPRHPSRAADIVAAQVRAVLDDIGADAIKTGMLGDGGSGRGGAGSRWPTIPTSRWWSTR